MLFIVQFLFSFFFFIIIFFCLCIFWVGNKAIFIEKKYTRMMMIQERIYKKEAAA